MASQAISTPLVFFLLVLPTALSQAQAPPTLSQCSLLFLPLVACAPFVQGTAQAPGQSCCDNLNQLYGQQPQCLCLVLGDTPISAAFPINRTLALQLPSLCSLHFSPSTCSGPTAVAKSPSAQVSLGENDNSTSAADSPSPTATNEMPRGRHTAMGLGLARSDATKATATVSNIHVFLIITLLGAKVVVPSLFVF
ncbi:unnamed protein product [Rhodiola kirilowii]